MAKKIIETKIEKENAIVVVVCSKKGDNIERKMEEINRLSFSANLISSESLDNCSLFNFFFIPVSYLLRAWKETLVP